MPQPPVHHSHTHDWVQTLRAKGLRATAQRVAVLDFLHHHPHTDAEAIFQAVRPSLPTISLQAIHLIVQGFSGNGLIRRISLPGSASARYDSATVLWCTPRSMASWRTVGSCSPGANSPATSTARNPLTICS